MERLVYFSNSCCLNILQKLVVYQTFRENDRNVASNKQCFSKIKKLNLLLHLEARSAPETLAGFSIYNTAFDMMLIFFFDMMSTLTLTA